jgi:carbamoyltransferase
MLYVGANLGRTSFGYVLPDGGLCALSDEKIEFAISEERLTRVKKDGGFDASLKYYLKNFGRSLNDIDIFCLSSCCDKGGSLGLSWGIPSEKLLFCDHHLSHAVGSFAWSGFTEAVVIVIDSGGNTLEEPIDGKWWDAPREQVSVYFVNRTSCKLIERSAEEPGAIGFGEFFRAVTYFIGWKGARFAGNTMALASLGNADRFKGLAFFEESGGKCNFPIGNNPSDPIGMVRRFLEQQGIECVTPRMEGMPFQEHHFDLAAWLQSELDRFVILTADRASRLCATKNIILSGGVAYNCVSVGRLQRSRSDLSVFVQPASGDAGQCLGNACFAHLRNEGRIPDISSSPVGLGGRHHRAPKHIKYAYQDRSFIKAVEWLKAGNLLIFFQGRSEYGPRALGFRSLLAAAHFPSSKRKLNRIKHRNYLMPVAPAVLTEERNIFFICENEAPYMAQCVPLRQEAPVELSACEHGNGLCRIQTVDRHRNKALWTLIRRFKAETGYPILFNTSLNGPGEPIVENPNEAMEFLDRTKHFGGVSAWINGTFYHNEHIDKRDYLGFEKSTYSEVIDNELFECENLHNRLSIIFPDLELVRRERFLLDKTYIEWVKRGVKTTTIRFSSNRIEYPAQPIIPLFETERFSGFVTGLTPHVGFIRVVAVTYVAFGDLDEKDAINDGFSSLHELKNTLRMIYDIINDFDIVTVFSIVMA